MTKQVRDPETEPSYVVMKKQAVKREGREEEFAGIYQELSVEHPDWSVMKRKNEAWDLMGLTSVVALERHRDFMREAEAAEAEVREEAVQEELSREEREAAFSEAFVKLPLNADRATVLEWIENHPAMVLPRRANEDGLIELTVADISDAPSRSAVGELQHWVNQKDAFYKELLKRKPAEVAGDGEEDGPTADELEDHDPTLKDVEKMLEDIGC